MTNAEKVEYLLDLIGKYCESRINVVLCMQKHFKRTCTACREYQGGGCKTYSTWVDAWIELQKERRRKR
jgi:hypothetical protein